MQPRECCSHTWLEEAVSGLVCFSLVPPDRHCCCLPPSTEARDGSGPGICPSCILCLTLVWLLLTLLLRGQCKGPLSLPVRGHGEMRLQAWAVAFSPIHDSNTLSPLQRL